MPLLSPETERVWNFLRAQPSLAGFVLIGGSALALRIQHRLSEDLDFACLAKQLPRTQLEVSQAMAAARGFRFSCDDDEAALEQFSSGGLDLHD